MNGSDSTVDRFDGAGCMKYHFHAEDGCDP